MRVALAALVAIGALAPAAAGGPALRVPAVGLHVEVAPPTQPGGSRPWRYWWDQDTVAVAGHRTTHGAPLRQLHRVRVGHLVWLGRRRYRVTRVLAVRASEVWVLNQQGLVLSACDPPGSAALRLVVLARPA